MKKLLVLIIALLASSCFSHKADEPIIVPPNFSEMPDVNHPEKPSEEQKNENVERLKELLLKSD